MTERQGFLGLDTKRKVVSLYINDKKTFNYTFSPEVKWTDDMQVISQYGLILDEGTPIMVRSNYWDTLINSINIPRIDNNLKSKTKFSILSPDVLIDRHSFLFYEPPELLNYEYHVSLVNQALGGNAESSKNFKNEAKKINDEEKIPKLLKNLPDFYQPFIEKQIHKILKYYSNDDDDFKLLVDKLYDENDFKNRVNFSKIWTDKRVDDYYTIHITKLILEAKKANKGNNSAVIPPVPIINRSSKSDIIDMFKDFNIAASAIRKVLGDNIPHVYLHLYIDWKTTLPKSSGNNASDLLPIIEEILEQGEYAGICLTLKGYENAAAKGQFNYIESFVTDLSSIAEYYFKPLILPRSKWYGLKLMDSSINCFGSLFNGKPKYSKRLTGFKRSEGEGENKIDFHYNFGYTYIINECVELDYDGLQRYINRTKKLPYVNHLPNVIIDEYWKDQAKFIMNISKPRRLSHMEEARYIRKDVTRNVIKPATRYLERSSNPEFGTKR